MYPFMVAAGVISFYFLAVALQRPRPAPILAFILWAAYAVYEYYVANGTLCDANCNIRVDLVLFLPLLGSAAWLALKENPHPVAVTIFYVVCLGLTALLARAFGYNLLAVAAGAAALLAAVVGVRAIRARKSA